MLLSVWVKSLLLILINIILLLPRDDLLRGILVQREKLRISFVDLWVGDRTLVLDDLLPEVLDLFSELLFLLQLLDLLLQTPYLVDLCRVLLLLNNLLDLRWAPPFPLDPMPLFSHHFIFLIFLLRWWLMWIAYRRLTIILVICLHVEVSCRLQFYKRVHFVHHRHLLFRRMVRLLQVIVVLNGMLGFIVAQMVVRGHFIAVFLHDFVYFVLYFTLFVRECRWLLCQCSQLRWVWRILAHLVVHIFESVRIVDE